MAGQKFTSVGEKISGPKARFYGFAGFLVVVFFTGGGSRDDIQSLLLLRPLAVLFCAYALTVKTADQWQGRKFPVYVACALLTLMVLQLIPLPPSIWTQLPGRQIFADIASIAGIEQPWRPLTLSPSKTLNTLFSLVVPIAAMMLYLNLDREYQNRAISAIIILCVISALLAVFQISGPARGPFYTYRITNFGTGVGLFANRNHQAVTLAASIAMLGWYASSLKPSYPQAALKFYASIATILVFVPLILITGSRAGVLLMIPALMMGLFLVFNGAYHAGSSSTKGSYKRSKSRPPMARWTILAIGIVLIVAMVISSVLLSRSLALDRLFAGNDVEELRVRILPTLFTMIKEYMPYGSGFGSFEHVYKIFEPQELLRQNYLNQAHNDWLQYPLEGGIPALMIAVCAVIWFAGRLWTAAKNWRSTNRAKYRVLMSLGVIMFLLAASIGDYPLRVPSIMTLFAILVCVLNDDVRAIQRRNINRH